MRRFVLALILFIMFSSLQCRRPQRPALMDVLRASSELATVQFVFNKYFVINKEKKLLGLITLNRAAAVLEAEATLTLGLDLTQLDNERIQTKNDTLNLQLPPLQALNFSFPIENMRLMQKYSDGPDKLGIITEHDWDRFYQESELVMREHINFLPLRQDARRQTQTMLQRHFSQFGYAVRIQFDDAEEPLL